MSRIKPKPVLITRAQVNSHLQRYALIQGQLEIERAACDETISTARKAYEITVAPFLAEAAQIEAEINHHILTCSADFAVVRTIKLRFGEIGIRKVRSDKLGIKTKLKTSIIEALKKLGLNDCIVVKEDIDARKLATYPDGVLDKIEGVERPQEKDDPWFVAFREPVSL